MNSGVNLIGWLLLIGGVFGLAATRAGGFDQGGFMRRMDWLDFYGLLEHSIVGGGVRRAMYSISVCFLVAGAVVLLW